MKPIIVWFRQDLRLSDNPALVFAVKTGKPLICLFTLDDETPGRWKMGGASRWWLHHSLAALNKTLAAEGGALVLRHGKADQLVPALVQEVGADMVVWNRCYEPFVVARDTSIRSTLASAGIEVHSFNSALLSEPWELLTVAGKPFQVFTPFWKALRSRIETLPPLSAPKRMDFQSSLKTDTLEQWNLLPIKTNWAKSFDWVPGEKAAQDALCDFMDNLGEYGAARDVPSLDGTSRLSPHLHFGEISPRQIWHAVATHAHVPGAEKFLAEIGWREFNHQLLFHQPTLPEKPHDSRFDKFVWHRDARALKAWQQGLTGVPLVDAGMRQLWQTGWMHNRVRMIAASFLIKHLGIDWRAGQDWFWDTLVDADLANNAAGWQWVAGSGADAAPFFRIFNPVLQGEKFDPQGTYVRRFIPELDGISDKYIHRPWEAPSPPPDYPAPIIDLAQGRSRALKAFKALKG